MIVSLTSILNEAKKNKYAIGGFNTFNLETTKAIVAASVNQNTPIIVQVSEKTVEYADLDEIHCIIKLLAEKAKTPIVIHLDHGKSFEMAQKCVDIGFSSVMIDGSRMSLEENIALTKKVVDYAHSKGVSVEGELGAVGKQSEDSSAIESMMTDPDEAARFVEETGIDALAIGCGTAHGMPLPDEKIHFDVIENIANKVSVPLVLHGSSNIDSESIKKAISLGICKINIDTEIRATFTGACRKFLSEKPDLYDPRDFLSYACLKTQAKIEEKIQIFKS